MNYTAEDIKIAKKWKSRGFNWAVREKTESIAIFRDKPYKLTNGEWSIERWADCDSSYGDCMDCIWIESSYFRNINYQDEEPTSLDSIIASENKIESGELVFREDL